MCACTCTKSCPFMYCRVCKHHKIMIKNGENLHNVTSLAAPDDTETCSGGTCGR